jgi:hypothetical protein
MMFFGPPAPGGLALAGCERMAVVPDEPMRTANPNELPDGLCPACVAAMRGQELPDDTRPVTDCRTCDGRTEHDGVCALCRQELHDQWVTAGRPDGVTLDHAVTGLLAADAREDAASEHLDEKVAER